MRTRRWVLVAGVALMSAPLMVVLSEAPVGAAMFTVTTTTDGGAGSLREAVQTLAVDAGGDTVVLQAGATYTLTCAQGGDLAHGNTPLTIQGNGATITMESGCNQRILNNGTGALVLDHVAISGVNISVASISGALISAGGAVTLTNSALTSNTITASGDIDGLVDAGGAVSFGASTVAGNTLNAAGSLFGVVVDGGVTMTGSSLTNTSATAGSSIDGAFNGSCQLTGTTIDSLTVHSTGGSVFGGLCDGTGTVASTSITNSSVVDGPSNDVFGGLFDGACSVSDSGIDMTTVTATGEIFGGICDGTGTLIRSTISRTTATAATEIFGSVFDGTASLTNSTLSHDTYAAPTVFGGLIDGATTLVYATVDANTAPVLKSEALTTFGSVIAHSQGGAACSGVTTTSNGFNFSDDTSCNLTGIGDRQGAGDPNLGPLSANGGHGLTEVPQTTSPLIDAIPLASCQSDGASGITTDERSLPRPAMNGCDIGAVEVQPAPTAVVVTPRFTG